MADCCYICLEYDNLIKVCSNTQCVGKIHKDCLIKQSKYTEDLTCGLCRNPIIFEKDKSQWFKILYTLFLFILSPSIIALSLGRTLIDWDACKLNQSCIKYFTIDIIVTLPIAIFWLQMPFFKMKYHLLCCKTLRHKSYITMTFMFLFCHFLILFAHCIGFIVLKYLEMDVVFFTNKTSFVGLFLIYGLITIASPIIYLLYRNQ